MESVWSIRSRGPRAFALAALLVGGLLLPAVCAAEDLGQWWLDPCDKLRKVRHEGSQEVHTQLKNVIASLKNSFLPALRDMFDVPPNARPLKHPWLNNAKFFREMKKQRNKHNAMAIFHRALQIYGGTIYKLNETEIESKAYDPERTSQFLANMTYEMKRLTCEVANELYENNVNSSTLKLEEMHVELDRKMDATRAALHYSAIVKNYRKFLQRSEKLLFGKSKDKGKKKGGGNKKNNKRKNRKQ